MLRSPGSAKSPKLKLAQQPSASWTERRAPALRAPFDLWKMRERWLAALTVSIDDYMRSGAFLEGLRFVMSTTTQAQLFWKSTTMTRTTANGPTNDPRGGASQ